MEHSPAYKVFFYGEHIVKAVLLIYNAYSPAYLWGVFHHVKATYLGTARGERDKGGKHIYGGGFSRSVYSEKAQKLALFNGKGYAVYSLEIAVLLCKLICTYDVHIIGPSCIMF